MKLINRLFRKAIALRFRFDVKLARIRHALVGQISIASRAIVEPKAELIISHKNDELDNVIVIGDKAHIKDHARLCPRSGFIKIGKGSSVNPFCILLGYGGITIGDHVRIAAHTSIIAFNHNFGDSSSPISKQGNNATGIIIEDNVWIGTGVRILDGVTIGEGSVIGAGSVVTKDIPSNSVAVGVPAKVIKHRI